MLPDKKIETGCVKIPFFKGMTMWIREITRKEDKN